MTHCCNGAPGRKPDVYSITCMEALFGVLRILFGNFHKCWQEQKKTNPFIVLN